MSYNRRTLSPDSPYAIVAALLMFASAAVMIVDFILSRDGSEGVPESIMRIFLPAACAAIMGIMLISRKKSLIPTVFPLIGIITYLIVRVFEFELWKVIVCIGFCTFFAVVYILTVTGALNTRTLLMSLCAVFFMAALIIQTVLHVNSEFTDILSGLSLMLIFMSLFVESAGMSRGRLYS